MPTAEAKETRLTQDVDTEYQQRCCFSFDIDISVLKLRPQIGYPEKYWPNSSHTPAGSNSLSKWFWSLEFCRTEVFC